MARAEGGRVGQKEKNEKKNERKKKREGKRRKKKNSLLQGSSIKSAKSADSPEGTKKGKFRG